MAARVRGRIRAAPERFDPHAYEVGRRFEGTSRPLVATVVDEGASRPREWDTYANGAMRSTFDQDGHVVPLF
jgi:hypothetical protein